jgi:hypothetical protein
MWDDKVIDALPFVVPGLAVLLLTAAYLVLSVAI